MSEEQIQFHQGSVKKAAAGMTSADLWKAPVDQLHVYEGFNVRVKDAAYQARVRAIADSIKENGFFLDKPIAGFVAEEEGNHVIYITDGHTRFEAVKLAISEGCEISEVPVVTKPRGTSMEDLTVALVMSNTGQQLTPFEVATVCKRLVGYGMEAPAIAKRLGMSRPYVENLLDLVAAPKAIRDMVTDGKVSATLAVQTIKAYGKSAAKVLSESVKEASAKGKERVTKKHVKAAAPTIPPIVKKGVQWMIDKSLTEDPNIISILAHLGGVKYDAVSEYIEQTAL